MLGMGLKRNIKKAINQKQASIRELAVISTQSFTTLKTN